MPTKQNKAGDRFEDVLMKGHQRFLTFLSARLRDKDLAEDILQTAYIKGLKSRESLKSDEAVIPWFFRILRNSVIDHYRRMGAEHRALERLANELEGAEERTPEPKGTVCRCAGELLKGMKPEYRDAVSAIDLEGVEMSRSAQKLGVQPGNLRVRLHRGRAQLKKRLLQTCGTCAAHGCMDCSCRRV